MYLFKYAVPLVMFTFSVFDCKYLFGQIWSKKSKFSIWAEILHGLIWTSRIMQKICGVHFFCFRPEKPFWVNLVKKIKIVSFKLKFSTKTNLNKCNLMMFTFSVFVHKYLSWANLVQKFKLACSKWIWYKD